MSYRPTISVYIDGHIADIGYYKNWDNEDLFFEALAIAALFHECRTVEEYKIKKYGRQKVWFVVEPEEFEDTEESLKFLEACSELPVLVDLTAKCIYCSQGAISEEDLLLIQSALDGTFKWTYTDMHEYDGFYGLLSRFRLPYDHLDMPYILESFRGSKDLLRHLSVSTAEGVLKDIS